MTPSPSLVAGRVGRPHGLDGSFHVTGARGALLQVGTTVAIGERHVPIERRAGTDERPILRVQGCADRDAAAALRGSELRIEADRAPALPEGEWWAHELEGCEVRDGEQVLGVVRRLLELPSCECLEVATPDGHDLLVPLVRDAIRTVDVRAATIDIDAAFLGEGSA